MKYTLLIVGVLMWAGCASDAVVVSQQAEQEDVNVLIEKDREDTVKAVESEPESDTVDVPQTEAPLQRETQLVGWGFTAGSRAGSDIDTIILHSVYNPFKGDRHGLREILGIFEGYGVAPHYIILRDGRVVQTVAEKDIAYHAGRSRVPDGRTNVNDFSLGIEMVNSLDDVYTDAQYAALRSLIVDIRERHDIMYILGHGEIAVEDPWHFDWERVQDLRANPE